MSRDDAPDAGADDGSKVDARIRFIDNARAIGIVLVVLGHAPALPALASDLIFAFHMPLFFVLSGLVVGGERLHLGTRVRAALLARTLLLPYFLYFLVSWLYWLAFKRHGLRADEFEKLAWWDPVRGFLYGGGDDLYVNVTLWFFPCLFLVALTHHVVARRLSVRVAAVALVCASCAFVLLHGTGATRWPQSADCAVVAAGFYALGAALNGFVRHPRWNTGRSWRVVAASLATIACCAMALETGHVDLNHLSFGRMPAFYVPMGVCGSAAVLIWSSLLPGSAFARWLAMNTLTIFPLHFLLFSVFTGAALVVLHAASDFKSGGSMIALIYTVLALIACWPAARLIHRLQRIYRQWHRGVRPPLPAP